MPAEATPRALVLRPECVALRRALGAMPWVALEVLAARAQETDDGLIAEVSVRGLAAELGVAKDTAARALSELRSRGVIVLRQGRTPFGQFAIGSYAIAAGAEAFDIDTSAEPAPARTSPATRASRPRRRPTTTPVQLSLLAPG